jgi:hypothetical protein
METPDTRSLQKAVNESKPNKGKKDSPAKLPSIADLYAAGDSMPMIQKESMFQVLVNQDPKPEWIKQHPMTKQDYLPIERVEWLATNIFLKVKTEIKDVKQIANSVVVTVRVHYYNQIDKEWCWQDGVGASPLQTEKGAGAIEWDKIKSSAVQMGAPAAESYARKDAFEKIGKLFGKDLKRLDHISYDSLQDRYAHIMD